MRVSEVCVPACAACAGGGVRGWRRRGRRRCSGRGRCRLTTGGVRCGQVVLMADDGEVSEESCEEVDFLTCGALGRYGQGQEKESDGDAATEHDDLVGERS